ncbi:MAG: exodeoxyribonuclease V subunit gamma [Planctomycetia bacterium]|nr:exodeoxyribonuclease V subunit gamma [Candidatus Brocadia sp.]QOJ05433.1 MAG: exodeoxyribonuclease V subunit gamma [Planctomycetia bacterium]TVL98120.1 MAG: hypothetical protein CV082_01660 [Candidatus Brocadia sp. BL1]HQU30634.1 exodeoxyribonuclease V subunit gamma [Candidatus Brocadia sapporoensis]
MLTVKIGHYHPSLEDSFVETVHTLKRDDPMAPLAVVVPTNWMLNRLQERLVQEQGASFMNLSFMNFYVLAKEICRRSGIEVGQIIQQPVIYEGIIAELLKQHLSTNPIFKNVPSPTTLASALFQVIQDLTDANVHADDLKEAVREGFVEGMEVQKLQGVIQLYDLFRQRLKSTNISHYSDIYRMVTSYITDSEFLRRFKYILAYGFYDLTGVEQDFFGEIFRAYPTILFLPYQKKHPGFAYVKPFFESFVLGMARDIEELCPDVSTGFSYLMDSTSEGTPVVSCQPLVTDQKVDTHFITHNEKCETRNQKLVIINVSGRHDEVWTVAKEILKLTDAGYAMETIGVVARSLEPYTDTIKKIFQENSIPFATSIQEPMEKYPLIKAIQNILLLKREDFYRPMVMELFGSPYFKIPSCDSTELIPHPDLWDALSRRLGIRSGIECWLARLEQERRVLTELVVHDNEDPLSREDTFVEKKTLTHKPPYEREETEGNNSSLDDEETIRHVHISAGQIDILKTILRSLSNDLLLLPEKASWKTLSAKTIHLLLNYIQIPSEGNPEDIERDHLILKKTKELLQTLCALDCMGEEVSLDQFIDTFTDACRHETLPIGLRNGRGVKVLDAMSARGVPFRVLFVLGLNEKMFPRAISEEPFLRDHVRRRLSEVLGNFISEKLRGFDEERLLFSFLLNAAREQLYLLYKRSDESGKPKIQSHYLIDILQTLKKLFPPTKDSGEKPPYEIYVPRSIKEKLCKQELLLLTPKEAGIRMALDRIDPTGLMKALGNNQDVFKRSQSALSFNESRDHHLTPYDGIVGDMSTWWNGAAYQSISPTTLETFGTCPFKFFMRKIMEIEPLEEPEMSEVIAAMDLGALYHNILRDFYNTLIEERYFTTSTKKINTRELLHSIAQKYFTNIEQQTPVPYPIIWEIEKEEILVLLTQFIAWDLEQIEKTGYIPTYLEKTVKLRLQNDLHKLIPESFKQGENLKIVFNGKIDRMDIKKEKNAISLRVIDYKSGKFLKENIMRYAIRGQKLQLPFYIIMAEHLLSEKIKKGHIPQGQIKIDEASFVYVAEHTREKTGQTSPQTKTLDSDNWMNYKEQYWDTLREFLKIIREGIFPVSPSEDTQKCEWCEFATTCRRGHQPLRLRLEHDVRLKKYREIIHLNIKNASGKS